MEVVLQVLLVIWGAVMAIGALLKSWAWLVSVRWALKHGAAYSTEIESVSADMTSAGRMRRIAQPKYDSGGAWPGAKSVKIWEEDPDGWRRVFDLVYLKTPCFLVGVAVFCWSSGAIAEPAGIIRFWAMFLATWLSLYALALILEAIIWYFIAQDYGLVWGDIKFATSATSTGTRALGDVKGLLAVVVTAIASCSVLVFVCAEVSDGYTGIQPSDDWSFSLASAVSSVYFVLSNTTTVGDDSIIPAGTAGRASAAIMHLTILLILGVVLTAVASRVHDRE
jgi:hypothetical protein